MRTLKEHAADMVFKYTLREDLPSETSLCPQKTKIQSGKRVGSYIGTNATWWTVKKNTLVSQQEILQRGLKNTLRPLPRIHDHSVISGHNVTIDNFEIVGREGQNLLRTIKEALYIRVNNPSLNKNIGKYHLPHIWDEVLHNISELKLE